MEQPADKALLQKFIDGHCTPAEEIRIRELLQQPGAGSLFEEILNEGLADTTAEEPVDEIQMRAWERKFEKRITADPPKTRQLKSSYFYKYAAVWAALFLTVGGYAWFRLNKGQKQKTFVAYMESRTATGKLLKVQLADSTIVYLNALSRLSYPSKFTGNTREVHLQGEAFFLVKHDSNHPFLVHTDQMKVQVLGTSFNVRSYADDRDVAVTVATGKVGVAVKALKNTAVSMLLPGRQLNYDKKSGKLKVLQVKAAESQLWQTGAFAFNYETFDNITKRLSRWYGVSFSIRNKTLLQKRFKLKLKNEPLSNVMKAMSLSGKGFSYEIKNNTVIIN